MKHITATALLLAGIMASGCLGAATSDPAGTSAGASGGNLGGAPGVSVTSVFPGDYDWTGPDARVLQPGPYAILPVERVVIPSGLDGEAIQMDVHRPDTAERVPVVVMAGPYFIFEIDIGTEIQQHFGAHVENLVPHGYAVVALSVRGTGGSGGCNDLMGPKEEADLDQAVTWLGEQDWSTGAVGMTGTSYDGSTPWIVAGTGNPYLKTIVPAAGVVDQHAIVSRNGSTENRGAPGHLNWHYYAANAASASRAPAQVPMRAACPDAIEGGLAGTRTSIDGTDATGFWAARDRRTRVMENYAGSVFAVHGLTDWNVESRQVIPFVDELERAGFRVKQLYGQWGHTYPGSVGFSAEWDAMHRADYAEILLRWFDAELKGLDVDTGAPVQVADDAGRWRNELHYPPRDAEWTTLHVADGGRLAPEPGARATFTLRPETTALRCVGGPLAGESADFTLGVVEEDMLIVGQPRAHLAFTPEGAGGKLSAYLCARAPDGTTRDVAHSLMDLAYADGTRERREVVPGVTLQAKMEMLPVDAVVPVGHELFLRVAYPVKYYPYGLTTPLGVGLEAGHEIASIVELPILSRGPEVYFEPPRPTG